MARGMILAAGRGTRLGPLTEKLPKPLLPVANTPVMAHGIASLRRLGITDIGVNVCYRGEQIIEAFDDGSAHDVRLHWLFEREATGTAGGMKGMQHLLDGDRIVVIAGDAMLDIDLQPLFDAHVAHGAFATLATIPVADPSLYGVVVSEADGRLRSFQEKPDPGTEISRQANTGIYIFEPQIFELIPPGLFCDFAQNIFPEILHLGLPFYAFPIQGYWTDIGNPGDYLQANLDYLTGCIHCSGAGRRMDDNLLADGARTNGARLSRCVVGDGVRIAAGCELTECVIWPGTTIDAPINLNSSVITPHGIFRIEDRMAVPLEASAVR